MTLIKAYEYHIKKIEELSGMEFAVTTIKRKISRTPENEPS
jgi:hypothetical protein